VDYGTVSSVSNTGIRYLRLSLLACFFAGCEIVMRSGDI